MCSLLKKYGFLIAMVASMAFSFALPCFAVTNSDQSVLTKAGKILTESENGMKTRQSPDFNIELGELSAVLSKQGVNDFFARLTQLIEKNDLLLLSSDVKAERLLDLVKMGLDLDDSQVAVTDQFAIHKNKRNLALRLLGHMFANMEADKAVLLKRQYSETLVAYVSSLRTKAIPDYKQLPVSINVTPIVDGNSVAGLYMAGQDPNAIVDAKVKENYMRAVQENEANIAMNRNQAFLNHTLSFMEVRVSEFLETHYANSADTDGQAMLKQYQQRLRSKNI